MIKTFRRLLKFALSRKTRNRSAGAKRGWTKRKAAKQIPTLAEVRTILNTAAREPSHHDDMSAISESGSMNRAELAPAVPVNSQGVKCCYCGETVYPEHECRNTAMANSCMNTRYGAPAVPDATKVTCRYCKQSVYPEVECFNRSMAEACHRNPGKVAPDTRDFRDYPSRDRPDWDLDSRGNPLKPGT